MKCNVNDIPIVSIIIVNYNTQKALSDCLNSIYNKEEDLFFEVIIVDNGSNDNSVEHLERVFPKVKVIDAKVNLGFGKANNLGVKYSRGKYLFFLNPDTILLNNAVTILYEFLISNPNVGLCGGNLYKLDNSPNESYSLSYPNLKREMSFALNRRAKKQECFNKTGNAKEVAWISGADMMISKELFFRIGMFDENLFMFYEEPDICNRLHYIGLKVFSLPSAKLIHLQGEASSKSDLITVINIDSQLRYLRKYNLFAFIVLFILRFLKSIFAFIYFSGKGVRVKQVYWSQNMKAVLFSLKKQDYYFLK